MDVEELAAELSHRGAQELLRTASLARLAYTGHDEFPRVIPIGFYWDGEQIFVCTAPTAPKVSALAARPNVALTIDTNEGTSSKALLIRGVAELEVVNGVPPEYIAPAAKSMDSVELEVFEANVRGLYKQMAKISITPQWARFYDFGAGRVPTFLHKLLRNNG
jgi:Pyridoxamine 5'-phosphate oxidase